LTKNPFFDSFCSWFLNKKIDSKPDASHFQKPQLQPPFDLAGLLVPQDDTISPIVAIIAKNKMIFFILD